MVSRVYRRPIRCPLFLSLFDLFSDKITAFVHFLYDMVESPTPPPSSVLVLPTSRQEGNTAFEPSADSIVRFSLIDMIYVMASVLGFKIIMKKM